MPATVVLVAGAGRRFGGRKLLARVEGRPLLNRVLDTLLRSSRVVPVDCAGLGSTRDVDTTADLEPADP